MHIDLSLPHEWFLHRSTVQEMSDRTSFIGLILLTLAVTLFSFWWFLQSGPTNPAAETVAPPSFDSFSKPE